MGLKFISEKFRDDVLKLNLKTPPDIVLGLVDLSGSALLSAYLDSIGKDAIIKNDKTSVILKDPGNILTDSPAIRTKNLNKNIKTPTDVEQGLNNLTASQSLAKQYLDGLGEPADINDYNVTNPGDVMIEGQLPRINNLKKNLSTPSDISGSVPSGYLAGRGLETVIGDTSVKNPGNIDDSANIERVKNLTKNKKINVNDPSESDALFSELSNGSYTYASLLSAIGQTTYIGDLNIPNATSISILSNQPAEVTLNLMLQQNQYIPTVLNTFEPKIDALNLKQSKAPYIAAYQSGIFTYGNQPQTYEPSQFLNISTTQSPVSILTNTNLDPVSYILTNRTQPLQDETLLMNIAALELKFNFESRIRRAVERETLGRTYLDEALTNPLTALNIIRNPRSIFELNYEITVSSNPIGKAAEFIGALAGIQSPISLIPDIRQDYTPKCFGNEINNNSAQGNNGFSRFINDLFGRTARQQPDVYYLNHTGAGQKYQLFSNIRKNKYSPNYLADYESGVFRIGEEIAQQLRSITGFLGLGAGSRPTGNFYIGNKDKNEDPAYLMQDGDGDIVKSNEKLTESLILATNPNGTSYEEPGYDEVSNYGNIQTDFIWKSEFAVDTILNPIRRISENINITNNIDPNKLSFNKYKADRFRECSILYKTSQLLEKTSEYGTPIDQTLTKFYDGYAFTSRANATISPTKVEVRNKQGEITGFRYLVPGLDVSGKRQPDLMYHEAELCRVWTKARPYSKITDLIRYKELLRKERNSVLDRYGNLNIFPTELNVNKGYGKTEGIGAATTEAFGEKRARKYMFSLENLAWRDSQLFKDLPDCEKGPNGGRIMWFPPYDISFTDDTTTNWTTHSFLGRPEPIYTYNNTERSGSLSWKIIVDHPSILNLLSQKELARLTDGEVDEILTAFWAGCIEFDIFELARIWNQFSQSDIDYFKKVISGLDLRLPNSELKPKVEQSDVFKQPDNAKVDDTNIIIPKYPYDGYGLFFENDVPLRKDFNKKNDPLYDTGIVQPFNLYFQRYINLANGAKNNVEVIKRDFYGANIDPNFIDYNSTLTKGDNYFFDTVKSENYYGFERQYKAIAKELSDEKYKQFDLNINIKAFASPLNENVKQYNDSLADRRFESAVKWLLLNTLNKAGKLYTNIEGTTEITNDNINDLFSSAPKTITVYRDKISSDPKINEKSKITFSLQTAKGITSKEIFEGNGIIKTFKQLPTGEKYFEVLATTGVTNNPIFYCFQDAKTADDVIKNKKFAGVADDRISSLELDGGTRSYADIMCSTNSMVASYSRRVEIFVEVVAPPPPAKKTITQPENNRIETSNDQIIRPSNITKRDIAQRILNKFITECDYFELLKSDAPILFDSLKQKLKYFTPAFHSMTPEGLNARLTFLQQCLRPGETIKRADGSSCDASNTAFGKPPVCVLRIGDFYNTKIVINNLNITYDPLLWDLNPEGIGVQPMLANIQMSFKYIGGSGLRKYVDELQNALSFNYYANADVYDSRTFANTDTTERNLVNLETSFFDNNTLDLIPIVARAEQFVSNNFYSEIPYGTIGIITNKRKPTTAGGAYGSDILTAKTYDGTKIYQPFEIVSDNDKFYVRKADDEANISAGNALNGSTASVGNKKYWEEIVWRNFGEQAFMLEFGKATTDQNINDPSSVDYLDKTYFNWYEVQYMDVFKELYDTYGKLIETNFALNKAYQDPENVKKEPSSLLLQLVLNKNYNKDLTTSGTGLINDVLNDLASFPTQTPIAITGTTTGSTKYYLYDVFDREAKERNYVEFKNYNTLAKNFNSDLGNIKIAPLKLHLYPQQHLYKIGDGNTLVSSNGTFDDSTRFNPGNLTGGNFNGDSNAEVSGIYLKDYTYYQRNINTLINALATEMEAKIKLGLNMFWFVDGNEAHKNYNKYFESTHKQILIDTLLSKFKKYTTNLIDNYDNLIDSANQNTAKFGVLLSGLSVITDGYDIRKTEDNKTEYFEVIPNEYKLKSDIVELFDFDPYTEYRTLSFNEFKKVTLIDVYSDIIEREQSDGNKLKFLSLGNGAYFFKQLTDNPDILVIASTGFTKNNSLMRLRDFNSTSPDAKPGSTFYTPSGVTLSTIFDKNGQPGTTKIKDLIPENQTPNTYSGLYRMTYTFEKLNYELFDFTNKTLDIMLNDNFMRNDFDIDITYNENLDFKKQLEAFNSSLTPVPLSFGDWLAANPQIDNSEGNEQIAQAKYDEYVASLSVTSEALFYYGANSNLVNIPINYYKISETLTGTTTNAAIKKINSGSEYDFIITRELLDNLTVNSTNLADKKIKMSGIIDMLFTDFFMMLTDNDKTDILLQLSEVTPRIGISTDAKTSVKQIEVRKKKIENILDSIFVAIYKFRDKSQLLIKPIIDAYTMNYYDVNIAVWKSIAGSKTFQADFIPTAKEISSLLMKGDVSDYTLVIKDTIQTNVNKSAINNYNVFTNNKALFNIITRSESPENIDRDQPTSMTTELSRYLKED